MEALQVFNDYEEWKLAMAKFCRSGLNGGREKFRFTPIFEGERSVRVTFLDKKIVGEWNDWEGSGFVG